MNKVALVTGASSGIGYETAVLLKEAGFTVYGAARREEMLKELEKKGIHTIKLDVTDETSMVNCVEKILNKEGRIDVLINNAGYGSYGAVEDIPIEEAKRQFEVNIFGLARMTQLVLPSMRSQHYGRIVNLSSMGGKVTTKFGAWYHATKFALEAFSDCLRVEVASFGIDVVLVEPGGIKTDWGIIAADNLKKTSSKGAYAKMANHTADGLRKMYQSNYLTKPNVIAKTILKAVTARKPKTRYLVGFLAKPSVFMRRVLPDRAWDAISGYVM